MTTDSTFVFLYISTVFLNAARRLLSPPLFKCTISPGFAPRSWRYCQPHFDPGVLGRRARKMSPNCDLPFCVSWENAVAAEGGSIREKVADMCGKTAGYSCGCKEQRLTQWLKHGQLFETRLGQCSKRQCQKTGLGVEHLESFSHNNKNKNILMKTMLLVHTLVLLKDKALTYT